MRAENERQKPIQITHPQQIEDDTKRRFFTQSGVPSGVSEWGKFRSSGAASAEIAGTIARLVDKGADMAAEHNPSREEVNAKLEAVEARLDGKLASIDGKLDRIGDQMVAFNTVGTERFENLSRELGYARDAAERAATSASNVKWNIFFTALGVIGVIFVMWQIWSEGVVMVADLIGASKEVSE